MTGWRVGWMIGPADLIKAKSQSPRPAMSPTSLRPLRSRRSAPARRRVREAFDRRRRTMHSLSGIEGVLCPEPEGAFYFTQTSRRCWATDGGGGSTPRSISPTSCSGRPRSPSFGEAFGVGGGRLSLPRRRRPQRCRSHRRLLVVIPPATTPSITPRWWSSPIAGPRQRASALPSAASTLDPTAPTTSGGPSRPDEGAALR